MWEAVRYLSRRQPLVLLAFVASSVFTVYFAAKLGAHAMYFSDPAHRAPPIAGWMTPAYVAMAHEIEPELLRDALSVESGRRRTLSEIARGRGLSLEALIDEVEAALVAEGVRRE